jgi:chaperonin GroEL (HSP60 family)
LIAQGYPKREVIAAIKSSVAETVAQVDKYTRPVTSELEMIQIATLSANGDKEIGEAVGKLAFSLGPNGFINTESHREDKIYGETKKGYAILSKEQIVAEQFMGNNSSVSFEDALVVMVDDNLDNIDQLQGLLQLRSSHKISNPIVIIARAVMGSVLPTLLTNYQQGVKIMAVRMPSQTSSQEWEDIGRLLGAKTVFSMTKGVPIIKMIDYVTRQGLKLDEALGKAKKITIFRDKIILESKLETAAADIIQELETRKSQSNDEAETAHLNMRISKLSQAIGIIYAGATTDGEKTRVWAAIDDAQRACFSALKGGMVLGGLSTAFAAAIDAMEAQKKDEREIKPIIGEAGGNGEIGVVNWREYFSVQQLKKAWEEYYKNPENYEKTRRSINFYTEPHGLPRSEESINFERFCFMYYPIMQKMSKKTSEDFFSISLDDDRIKFLEKEAESQYAQQKKPQKALLSALFQLSKRLFADCGNSLLVDSDDVFFSHLSQARNSIKRVGAPVLFDPIDGTIIENGWERGIIEPANVLKSCLKIGSTQAIEFLNTGLIINLENK